MKRGVSTVVPEVDPRGFVVVDTETTGLHDPARVIEVALVFVSPLGNIETSWTSLIRGGGSAGGPRLEKIHGIRDSDLVRAPSFATLATPILESFRGRVVFAHNSKFDRARLNYELTLAQRRVLPELGCTMYLGSHLGHGILRLAEATARFGIPLTSAHAAHEDALATARLLSHYMRDHPRGFKAYLSKKGFA